MSTPCPICGGSDATLLFSRPPDHDPAGRVFSVLRCSGCGVERLDPLPTEEELDAAYGAAYYERHSPDTGTAGRLRRLAWDVEIRPLKRHLRPGVRVLEVGCGTGELLSLLRRRYGADVQGIERSEAAIAACRAKGVPVHAGALEDAPIDDAGVDVMIMRHVLEHVTSPRDLLATARRLLAPRGALLLTVPVTGGWDQRLFGELWDGYRVPEHIVHFPPRSVDALLRDAGFTVAMRRHSVVPNPWVNAVERRLQRDGRERAARFVTLRNPLALVLTLPISAAAAAARRSGRMTVLALAPA
jgi:SAM-dependent methyltransferase